MGGGGGGGPPTDPRYTSSPEEGGEGEKEGRNGTTSTPKGPQHCRSVLANYYCDLGHTSECDVLVSPTGHLSLGTRVQ